MLFQAVIRNPLPTKNSYKNLCNKKPSRTNAKTKASPKKTGSTTTRSSKSKSQEEQVGIRIIKIENSRLLRG